MISSGDRYSCGGRPGVTASCRHPGRRATAWSRNDWICGEYVEHPPPRSVDAARSTSLITVAVGRCSASLVAVPLALLARRCAAARAAGPGRHDRASTRSRRWPCSRCCCRSPGCRATTVVDRPGALLADHPGPRHRGRAGRGPGRRHRGRARAWATGDRRLLWRCELPLALPAIMAGLRVATVSTVALTTVGAIVGYGGLGNLISRRCNTLFKAQVLTASVLCVALALVRRPAAARRCSGLRRPWRAGRPRVTEPARDLAQRMTVDAWAWLTDGANWSGSGRRCRRGSLEHVVLSAISLLRRRADRSCRSALWLGHIGRGGALAVNIANVGRAVPDVRRAGRCWRSRRRRSGSALAADHHRAGAVRHPAAARRTPTSACARWTGRRWRRPAAWA